MIISRNYYCLCQRHWSCSLEEIFQLSELLPSFCIYRMSKKVEKQRSLMLNMLSFLGTRSKHVNLVPLRYSVQPNDIIKDWRLNPGREMPCFGTTSTEMEPEILSPCTVVAHHCKARSGELICGFAFQTQVGWFRLAYVLVGGLFIVQYCLLYLDPYHY